VLVPFKLAVLWQESSLPEWVGIVGGGLPLYLSSLRFIKLALQSSFFAVPPCEWLSIDSKKDVL
jgi:hypothetical protein